MFFESAAAEDGAEWGPMKIKGLNSQDRQRWPGLSGAALLEALPDAVLLADAEGRILDGNRRALELTQFTRAELQGLTLSAVVLNLPAPLPTLPPEEDGGRGTVLETGCRRKDRSILAAEVAVSGIGLAAGRGWCLSLRALAPRTAAQECLRAELSALQRSACGLALVDLHSRIQYANPAFARLWGVTRIEDLLGKSADEVWGAATTRRWLACVQARQRWVGELALTRKNGQPLHVETTAEPQLDEQDHLLGMVLSFIAVPQRKLALEAIHKEAEQQLRPAREQQDFAGQLHIISIPDLVQLIESAGKSGQLEILRSADGRAAALTFQAGQLIRAVCGDRQGAEAFYDALGFGGDAFHFRPDVAAEPDPAITQSTMSLLLEGLRRLDEAQHAPVA
ncbi:MAG: PAS domain-containing protein [Kiritimatiellaeota bacterium]|nr:PAS domain-containing protein [Kiritimatiellota bacterium]